MEFSEALIIGGMLSYVGALIYLANQVDLMRLDALDADWRAPVVRWLLYGLIGMVLMIGLNILLAAIAPPDLAVDDLPEISGQAGVFTLIVAWIAGVTSLRLVMSADLRLRLQGWLARVGGNYNPDSEVHLVATVLMLAVIVYMTVTFVSLGGVSGMAEDLAANGLQPTEVVFQGALEVVVAFLGVGLAIRRGWAAAAQRLGLRLPTQQDLTWGVGIGLACFLVAQVVLLILVTLFSAEWLLEQSAASDQLAASFSTIPLAVLLAVSAGVGEEIWVRGSLQPVFGLLVSSLFFTALHIQLTFTPGTLVILGVSLAFGWLRHRYSTTAAIIAHFIYNFVQLALASLVTGI